MSTEERFRWEDIDRRLLNAKTYDLAEEMHKRAAEAERRIAFEGYQLGNSGGFLIRLFDFHEQLTNEWAEKLYAAHCDAWIQQDRSISPEFIRAIRDRAIAHLFAARKSSMKSYVEDRWVRIGEAINKYVLTDWDLRMDRLASRWRRKLEADAAACEYRAAQSKTGKRDDLSVRGRGEPENVSIAPKRLGRRPRLNADFTEFAGNLWLQAKESNEGKISTERLRTVAAKLDGKAFLPPAKFLERFYAKEMRAFNSQNSNSVQGPIKTWSQLVPVGDKDHLRGMRKLLSRCASKLSAS